MFKLNIKALSSKSALIHYKSPQGYTPTIIMNTFIIDIQSYKNVYS